MRNFFRIIIIYIKEESMKKISLFLLALVSVIILSGCCKCESEPIIEANHALIIPRNFGNMPK